ncbi:MAG: CinA family protein [Rhodospirillaceae bacterium]|jgi:nicotinamide-nucleotide amidase|nr:CinA family protein [Rhodospirillaceae bacterium]MBT7953584.1 CinA family protein [Rhodospirillaceae bacterium]
MFPSELTELTSELIAKCRDAGVKIATAESCTGGLIAGCLTAVSGSSDVFERGFNTYSNEAKNEMLGVPLELINEHGAVSESVAGAMAEGALKNAPVQLTVAVTGVAGPGGGSAEKPVGTVQIASACEGKSTINERFLFEGDRDAVRQATVKTALDMMLRQVS